jgi:hypothetical protein
MKIINILTAAILLITAGCTGDRQSSGGLVTVDVTASYPKKELVLQDFMDVEYIPLETTGEFICQGMVMAAGKDIMIIKNQANDGDIFIFDRKGKGLRKFSHKGKGAEEYMYISEIILDEDRGEMFVKDIQLSRIQVYDLFGGYRRTITYADGMDYGNMCNFDKESIICRNASTKNGKSAFVIISRQDGSIVKDLHIDFEEVKRTVSIAFTPEGTSGFIIRPFPRLIPDRGSWLLIEPSSDTVYRVSPDYSMEPFMARTPSIQSMNPETFFFPGTLTGRYVFMASTRKENFSGQPEQSPQTSLVYDHGDSSTYECTVYNGDYSNEMIVDMVQQPVNDEIAFQQKIEAIDLVEAAEKGQLKGRLKEIAEGLEEESNPVIMLVKHKE